MTGREAHLLRTLYIGAKGKLDYLLDRAIDLCDVVLIDAHRLPWPQVRRFVSKIVRCVGDICWLLRAFPRLPAYRLVGLDWQIVFVGEQGGLRETRYLFSGERVKQQDLGRIALWKLSAQTQQWLSEGTDLVICESSRLRLFRPKAPITFAVPAFVRQSLSLTEKLEAMLSGRDMAMIRRKLNKAERANFSWYFSKAEKDFAHFHYNMYLPHIKERYDERALLSSYEDQWRHWFAKRGGGLVIVTMDGVRVAGWLCYASGDTVFAVECGVLGGSPDLLEQEIKAYLDWSAIAWAHQQGARVFDMGSTRPRCCDGVFFYKSRWRGEVSRRLKVYHMWTFLASDLVPELRDCINGQGFISEIGAELYKVYLASKETLMSEDEIAREVAAARKVGLNGLAIVSANAEPVLCEDQL
jgi:hypothetical protein